MCLRHTFFFSWPNSDRSVKCCVKCIQMCDLVILIPKWFKIYLNWSWTYKWLNSIMTILLRKYLHMSNSRGTFDIMPPHICYWDCNKTQTLSPSLFFPLLLPFLLLLFFYTGGTCPQCPPPCIRTWIWTILTICETCLRIWTILMTLCETYLKTWTILTLVSEHGPFGRLVKLVSEHGPFWCFVKLVS